MTGSLDVVPHLQSLWRYARVLTRSDVDADDLVQETLARALAAAHQYDPKRPLRTWLIAILRNSFLTDVARRNRDLRQQENLKIVQADSSAASQEDGSDLSRVGRALGELPPDQAEVLHLVAVLGFTYQEAAEILVVPVGTVMSRLSRGRANLRAAVSERRRPSLRIAGGSDGGS